MGGNIPRCPSSVLATDLCVVCFICYDWSVYVLMFSSCVGRGNAPHGRGWVSVVASLSVASDMAGVCKCITFTFVYFSVVFIWKNGGNVVSSLLVRAILLCVTNLLVCFDFYLLSFYLRLLRF